MIESMRRLNRIPYTMKPKQRKQQEINLTIEKSLSINNKCEICWNLIWYVHFIVSFSLFMGRWIENTQRLLKVFERAHGVVWWIPFNSVFHADMTHHADQNVEKAGISAYLYARCIEFMRAWILFGGRWERHACNDTGMAEERAWSCHIEWVG